MAFVLLLDLLLKYCLHKCSSQKILAVCSHFLSLFLQKRHPFKESYFSFETFTGSSLFPAFACEILVDVVCHYPWYD
jgi:hypothetical protein